MQRLIQSMLDAPHCYDSTFDDPPEDREAVLNLNKLHEFAVRADELGLPCTGAGYSRWSEMWPRQDGEV